jgi:hypothetical protein
MPRAADYRDMPHVWQAGFFRMDFSTLKERLSHARLILGNVQETVPAFLDELEKYPVGFVSFDLDYHSSTMDAFRIFEGPSKSRLPRVFCYFDDIVGSDWEIHSRFVGELLAIEDFNSLHSTQKISQIHLLRHKRRFAAVWNDKMFVHQDFGHPLVNVYIGPTPDRQLSL